MQGGGHEDVLGADRGRQDEARHEKDHHISWCNCCGKLNKHKKGKSKIDFFFIRYCMKEILKPKTIDPRKIPTISDSLCPQLKVPRKESLLSNATPPHQCLHQSTNPLPCQPLLLTKLLLCFSLEVRGSKLTTLCFKTIPEHFSQISGLKVLIIHKGKQLILFQVSWILTNFIFPGRHFIVHHTNQTWTTKGTKILSKICFWSRAERIAPSSRACSRSISTKCTCLCQDLLMVSL